MKIVLVLGAGGPVGHAFHAGVLRALADECDWDARHAETIIGTSAGAFAGALLRAQVSPYDLFAASTGGPLSQERRILTSWHRRKPEPAPPERRWPASSEYLRSLLKKPWAARPGRVAAALLPEGARENAWMDHGFQDLYGQRWPERTLWITAVHLDTGNTMVFGREGAPVVGVGTAVRCSAAVPGLCRPVAIEAGRFVDGAMASPTHLDLIEPEGPTLVIVSSPLSRFAPMRLLLRKEARRLIRRDVEVALFEPDAKVAAEMGYNPMDPKAVPGVAKAALESCYKRVRAPELARMRELLSFAARPLAAIA